MTLLDSQSPISRRTSASLVIIHPPHLPLHPPTENRITPAPPPRQQMQRGLRFSTAVGTSSNPAPKPRLGVPAPPRRARRRCRRRNPRAGGSREARRRRRAVRRGAWAPPMRAPLRAPMRVPMRVPTVPSTPGGGAPAGGASAEGQAEEGGDAAVDGGGRRRAPNASASLRFRAAAAAFVPRARRR